ncbi:MAG: SDR family oxidoreductase [Planctomycetota bacterium]
MGRESRKNPAEKSLRVVFITGATHGIGRALAEEFIRLGHTVAGCGRSAGEIAALRKNFGAPHNFDVVDVAADAAVAVWAKRVLAAVGTPDLLVNNAARINRNAPLWKIPAAEFDSVVDVNVKGVANVIRHVVPAMAARKAGVIVNISSGWGRSTSPEVAPYCATKWAVEGLTKSLAQELPAGMAAVPLNPGVINTRMLRSCFGASAGNCPSPEAWARVAAPFLLALGAKDNGESLTVTGMG